MRYLLLILSLLVAQPAAAIIIKQGPGGSGDASVRSAADCTAETGGTEDEVCVETGTGQGVFRCSTATCEGAGWERADDTVGAGGGIVNDITADVGGTTTGANITLSGQAGMDTTRSVDTILISFDPTELVDLAWGTGVELDWTFNGGAVDPVLTVGSDSVAWVNVATFTLDTEQVISTPVGDGESLAVTGSGSVEATLVTVPATTTAGQSPMAVDQAVHVNGYDAVNGCVEVVLADADDAALMPSIGISTATITDGDCDGEVTVSGTAVGAFGAGLSSDDALYVSTTAGAVTTTKPTGTAAIQKLANVLQEGGASDRIQIFGAGRSNDVPNIASGSAWVGDGSSVATPTDIATQTELDLKANIASPSLTGIVTFPIAATPTTSADAEMSFDTDGWGTGFDALEIFNGTASAYVIAATATDTPTNGQVPKWNTGGEITWEDDGGGGSGAFSDAGDPVVLNTITKDTHMGDGAGTLAGKVEIGGDADQPQLVIEGFSTQTDDILIIQNDADSEVFSVGNTGAVTCTGCIDATDMAANSVDGSELVDNSVDGTELDLSLNHSWTGVGTTDFAGAVTATSFTADPSATPGSDFIDSDTTDGDVSVAIDINCTATGTGAEDCDYTIGSQEAGSAASTTPRLFIDADGPLHLEGDYVYVGDQTTPVTPDVANGENDLYVEADLEVDGVSNLAGVVTFGAVPVFQNDSIVTANITNLNVTEDKLAATLTFDATDLLDFTAWNNTDGNGLIVPNHATDCTNVLTEGQLCWEQDAELLWVGDGTGGPTSINGGSGGETLAQTLALGADGNDVDMTSLGRLEFFDAGLYFDADADGVMDITSDGTLELHSADWDISTTGVITGAGNITSDGTVAATTVALGADPADAGALRLSDDENLSWEGTAEVSITSNTSDVLEIDNSQAGVALTTTTATECVYLDALAAQVSSTDTATSETLDGTLFPYTVWGLQDTTADEDIYWQYGLPPNIVGTTATVEIEWTTRFCETAVNDDLCLYFNGGGFQDGDAYGGSSAAFSGTEEGVQDACVTGDASATNYNLKMTAATTWTHGYDVADPKDTSAIFKLSRDIDLAHADCTGDNLNMDGDAQIKGVRICYEVDNVFSGE